MVPICGGAWLLVAVTTSTVLVVCVTAQGSGGNPPSCASKLTTCAAYINGTTTPPASCCDPLKEVVTEERVCLCSIYNNPGFLQSFHINITKALSLPKRCHINTGKSDNICQGGGSESGTKSGSSRIPMTGLLFSFLLCWTYLLFC